MSRDNNKMTIEEAIQILSIYLLQAEADGDDVSREQDALACVANETGYYFE